MKGPAADIAGSRAGKLGMYFSGDAWAATDASRSNPNDEGVKMGSTEQPMLRYLSAELQLRE